MFSDYPACSFLLSFIFLLPESSVISFSPFPCLYLYKTWSQLYSLPPIVPNIHILVVICPSYM